MQEERKYLIRGGKVYSVKLKLQEERITRSIHVRHIALNILDVFVLEGINVIFHYGKNSVVTTIFV